MKTLNQEIKFVELDNFSLTDEEMILVRGGDGIDDKGTTTPPVTDPEI